MTTEEVEDFIARWEQNYLGGDSSTFGTFYADDSVIESPLSGQLVGRNAIVANWRSIASAFPDLAFQRRDCLIRGQEVVWTGDASGSDTGGLFGQAPTRKPFRMFVVFLLTLDQGHIVHERRVYDLHGLLMQLGTDFGTADAAHAYRATLERTRADQELRTAGEIQQALLPDRYHKEPGFEVAAASIPCRAVGGDFVDYFNLPEGRFGFVLGDVAGKGPPAALLAAVLQGIFAANAHRGDAVRDILKEANDALVHRATRCRFATVVYSVLSSDGRLTYSNAGHNPPFLIRKGGVQRLQTGGLVVGAFEQATFDEETVRLEPGDVLVVYSDGITEAHNPDGEQFGEERLLSCIKADCELGSTDLLQRVVDAVRCFSGGAAQVDDLTVLVLCYSGSAALAV